MKNSKTKISNPRGIKDVKYQKYRFFINDAANTENIMFYQQTQYLSSFIRRIYTFYGVTHPTYLPFVFEQRLQRAVEFTDIHGYQLYENDIVRYKDGHLYYVSEMFGCWGIFDFQTNLVKPFIDMSRMCSQTGWGTVDVEIVGNFDETSELKDKLKGIDD